MTSPKIVEPIDLRELIRHMDSNSDLDAYQRLLEFCNKHRLYSDPPAIEIPVMWAGVVLNCLVRLKAVDPSLRIRRIANEDSKLRIYHSYSPRFAGKIDEIKVNTYNAIDRLILKKIGQALNNKSRILL